jgi:NADH:ubiquinone oxidoreductase subunit 2 (subunit N)
MPTPVSALIHAATLVTAGLYLLVRSSPLLEYSSTALLVITLVGASTAFFAATCGLVQNDLKRIIAFSTISQLGYFPILIITFLSFCLCDLDSFYFNNKLNYTINSISILSSFAFFSTKNLDSKYPKVESLKKIRDNFSSTISYVDKYNDFRGGREAPLRRVEQLSDKSIKKYRREAAIFMV